MLTLHFYYISSGSLDTGMFVGHRIGVPTPGLVQIYTALYMGYTITYSFDSNLKMHFFCFPNKNMELDLISNDIRMGQC